MFLNVISKRNSSHRSRDVMAYMKMGLTRFVRDRCMANYSTHPTFVVLPTHPLDRFSISPMLMCFPLPCLPPQQIFRPPLDHYDVIIHLHSRLLPRGTQSLDRRKHLTEQASLSRPSVLLPVVNFDPAQLYLEELKVRKGSTLLTHAVFDFSFSSLLKRS